MDPRASIKQANQQYSDGEFLDCLRTLNDLFRWSANGGFCDYCTHSEAVRLMSYCIDNLAHLIEE